MAQKKKVATEQVEKPASVLPAVNDTDTLIEIAQTKGGEFGARLMQFLETEPYTIETKDKVVKVDNHVEFETARQRRKELDKIVKEVEAAAKEVVAPLKDAIKSVEQYGNFLTEEYSQEVVNIDTLTNNYVNYAYQHQQNLLAANHTQALANLEASQAKESDEKAVIKAINELLCEYEQTIRDTWTDAFDATLEHTTLELTFVGKNTYKDYQAEYYDRKWQEALANLDTFASEYISFLEGIRPEAPEGVAKVYQDIDLSGVVAEAKPVSVILPAKGVTIEWTLELDKSKELPTTLFADLLKECLSRQINLDDVVAALLKKLSKEHDPDNGKKVLINGVVAVSRAKTNYR